MLTANNSLLILKLEIRYSIKQITRDNFALAASLTIRWPEVKRLLSSQMVYKVLKYYAKWKGLDKDLK
ncbi:hypothetical protein LCER1_G009372 [Lachnellula cervina]|uniref:Uncharacterized protein n=1 Tax=Lachnellula cervina TaxID=1316786 RepID=A0A7D8UL62_9HELO|nr:hypothetical protein LCER1_G009372 [Lachnellula cervina]